MNLVLPPATDILTKYMVNNELRLASTVSVIYNEETMDIIFNGMKVFGCSGCLGKLLGLLVSTTLVHLIIYVSVKRTFEETFVKM